MLNSPNVISLLQSREEFIAKRPAIFSALELSQGLSFQICPDLGLSIRYFKLCSLVKYALC